MSHATAPRSTSRPARLLATVRTSGPRTALDRYRAELDSAPLSREQERQLAERYRGGDELAGEQLVRACLPFVLSIAREYRRWGTPLEDVVQEGNMGLLRAASKFDPSREVRLVTYAAYWIRATIREYVVRSYRLVRLGTTKGERRALRAYRTAAAVDIGGLAEISGLSPQRVEQLLPLLSQRETSLDEPGDGDGGNYTMARLRSSEPSPEQHLAERQQQGRSAEAVHQAIEQLSEREQFIVRKRLLDDDPLTLQALGEQLGVSKERVRQLEERARTKLRGALAEFRQAG